MKKVGHFTVYTKQLLGSGSFAKVYLGGDVNNPNVKYACKVINKLQTISKYQDSYIIGRVKTQVQIWKQLDHPNIVKFYDCQESNSNLYFFLQICDQKPLQYYIDTHRFDQKVSDIIRFFKGLVRACMYIYEKNIIHRDIKPQNILLKDGQIKLSDFGLSRTIDKQEKFKNIWTMTKVGTPVYMAPQVLNSQKYTFKCDVWSVGVTLYELMTGYLPFKIEKKQNSPNAVLQKLKKNIEQYNHQIFYQLKQLTEILRQMLEIQPQKRISIQEVFSLSEKLKLDQNK